MDTQEGGIIVCLLKTDENCTNDHQLKHSTLSYPVHNSYGIIVIYIFNW